MQLYVRNGSIYIKDSDIFIDNICIVIDKTCGIMKYGDAEKSDIKNYYEKMCKTYIDAGCEDIANDIIMIEFDRYNGELNIDEICTLVNYGLNCHSEKYMKIFEMDSEQIKIEISRLKEYGF